VSKLNILIVSHEPLIANYLRVLLQVYGLPSTVATSSEAAIRKARKFTPDVLVIDPVMPHPCGVETALHISQKTKCAVLFMSTMVNDPGFREELYRVRAEGCNCRAMALPFEKADLLRKLQLLASCR
jgi:chemotaxis response regulator CheB